MAELPQAQREEALWEDSDDEDEDEDENRKEVNEEDEEADDSRPIKSWNFQKNHTYIHAPDDILAKGVTRNFATNINEAVHLTVKGDYHAHGNGHDVEAMVRSALTP